jgi:hypothetical protein
MPAKAGIRHRHSKSCNQPRIEFHDVSETCVQNHIEETGQRQIRQGALPRLPSDLRRTAIDEQFNASDKTRVVRGQK